MTINDVFTERKRIAEAVFGQTLEAVQKQLNERGKADRSQVKDNAIFGPISAAVAEAYKAGEAQLAIWLSEAAFKKAKEYEERTGGEIHKGAITFDLALMYLFRDDFTAALRYFEIAEVETRATETAEDSGKTPSTFALFRFELFEKNFWDRIDGEGKRFPVMGYKELWNVDYDKTAAKADWDKLSNNSKLLYIITVARRMRYRLLAEETTSNGANSLHLAHWNLTADLARIIETELKPKKQCPANSQANTLGQVLEQCFKHTTKPQDLSASEKTSHQTRREGRSDNQRRLPEYPEGHRRGAEVGRQDRKRCLPVTGKPQPGGAQRRRLNDSLHGPGSGKVHSRCASVALSR